MGEEIFIDANIFLEIFLEDTKSQDCENFLKSLDKADTIAITSDFVIYSCILIVENKLKNIEALKSIVQFFNSFDKLKVIRPSLDQIYLALEIIKHYNLDFDDALVVSCMKSYGIEKIASFDKHFDKVKEVKRIYFT